MDNQVREEEVEIDLLELFQESITWKDRDYYFVVSNRGCPSFWWNKIFGHTTIFFDFNDIYLDKDNKCNFSCGYPDGKSIDKRFCDFSDKSPGCE